MTLPALPTEVPTHPPPPPSAPLEPTHDLLPKCPLLQVTAQSSPTLRMSPHGALLLGR